MSAQGRAPWELRASIVVALGMSCTRSTPRVDETSVSASASENALGEAAPPVAASALPDERRDNRDAAAAAPEQPSAARASEEPAPPDDTAYAGDSLIDATRSEYAVTLPDEHATLPIERTLRIDDADERAVAFFLGAGLPVMPGLRMSVRAGWLGFVLSTATGTHFRSVNADALQRYLLHRDPPRSGLVPLYRRTPRALFASRAGLSASFELEPDAPARPLTCRLFVAILLGGDPAAARTACADVPAIRRVTLRAQGYPSLAFERTRTVGVRLPRAQLAVPPQGAIADLDPPARPGNGAFFSPAELRSLGGRRLPQHTLTVVNNLPREILVFVDELALGWLAPGESARYEGLAAEEHPVRFRTLDGALRTPVVDRVFPSTMRPGLAPEGHALAHIAPSRHDGGL